MLLYILRVSWANLVVKKDLVLSKSSSAPQDASAARIVVFSAPSDTPVPGARAVGLNPPLSAAQRTRLVAAGDSSWSQNLRQ